MSEYILSIDQGTTGSRAFIFNRRGQVVSSAYQEFKQYYPKPGWVEHDANEIWQSVEKVIKSSLRKSKIKSNQIKAIGITNQRETIVVWDRKTGRPLHKAIVWQCRRTSELCQKPSWKKKESLIKNKTGLVLDPYFSGTKIKWLLDNVKGLKQKAEQGRLCFGTIDSWLIWKLTGGQSHATDMSNASRTLLFNIKTKKWDAQLLKMFGVFLCALPEVKNSGDHFGKTIKVSGLSKDIPITGVLGDQQAALYGQGCFNQGSMKNTYGTGCFLLLNTGKNLVRSKSGLLTTIASDAKGKPVYALEGAVFIGGAVMQWLRDELQLIKHAKDSEVAVKGIKDANGVYVVPAFVGLGAPYWDADARGIITGLTRGANRSHIIRAALESMAYQTKDVVDAMQKDFGKKIKELRVDGGACANNFLMQFQSDMLNARILRPTMVDTTVKGAAFLAGVTIGLWSSADVKRMNKIQKIFKPQISVKTRDKKYSGWLSAVEQCKAHH